MRIIFRVDSGYRVASGHLMRCKNLALSMKNKGYQVEFLSKEYPGNLIDMLEKDFIVHRLEFNPNFQLTEDTTTWLGDLPTQDIKKCYDRLQHIVISNDNDNEQLQNKYVPIDLLVIDHYGIDYQWEDLFRLEIQFDTQIFVIDDLHNRKHHCDYLLDQTFYLDSKYNPYKEKELISNSCECFLGTNYLLLSPLFSYAHQSINIYSQLNNIKHVQINFGGVDRTKQTLKVVQWLLNDGDILKDITFDILLGRLYDDTNDELQDLIKEHTNFIIYRDLDYSEIIDLLKMTDLYIGATGVSIYERCCLGIPSIGFTLVDNQKMNASNLSKTGALTYLGNAHDCTKEMLISTFQKYISDPILVKTQREKCYKLVDGNGCQRLLSKLFI